MQHPPPPVTGERMAPIASYFAGKHVLVTGGTGFLGKVLVEKLLRSCSEVAKVYLLIRPSKDRSPQQRLDSMLRESGIFEVLRESRRDFEAFTASRLVAVAGDLLQPELGLSDGDLDVLTSNVQVVIHCAATVNFSEPLLDALSKNTMGCLKVLSLAQRMPRLEVLNHCSTCYVNVPQPLAPNVIPERMFPIADDPERLLRELLSMDAPTAAARLPSLLGDRFPNTYTFTKNLGEHLLRLRKGNTPLVISRPAIVGATYDGPIPGWVDNANTIGSFMLGGALGLVKLVPGSIKNMGDCIPVDFVVNAMLAATARHGADPVATGALTTPPIYHMGSSDRNPFYWHLARDNTIAWCRTHLAERRVDVPDIYFLGNPLVFRAAFFAKYTVPTKLLQAWALVRRTPEAKRNAHLMAKASNTSWRIAQGFEFFVKTQYCFSSANLMDMYACLDDNDRKEFNFDAATIDWHHWVRGYCWGLKQYVLKDPDTHPRLERHQPLYFERRPFQMFADVLWAYYTNPNVGTQLGLSAPDAISEKVLHSPRIKALMAEMAAQEGVSEHKMHQRGRDIMKTMASEFYLPLLRVLAWFFRKVYRSMYDAIIIDEYGMKRLKDTLANVPTDKLCPMVLIPTHRSYIDFLMISYLMFAYELPVPHIAAGDDFLNMALVRWIFRHAGAFFIRRTLGDDLLYRSIFEEYVHQLLLNGYSIEFFIEGTRSRTGKNLPPKLGLFSMIMDPFLRGQVDDMLVVPISINYEKMIEEENHVRELLGESKKKPTLSKLINATFGKVIGRSYGRINVQLAAPIRVSSFMQTCIQQHGGLQAYNPRESLQDKFDMMERLGYTVLSCFQEEAVIMTTAMVAAIVLAHRHGVERDHLIQQYEWLTEQVLMRGGRVDHVKGLTVAQTVDRAIKLLGEEVAQVQRNFVEPRINTKDDNRVILGLGIYRNQVPHVFFADSVCACVITRHGEQAYKGLSVAKVVEEARWLGALLSIEFHTTRDPSNEQDYESALLRLDGEVLTHNGSDVQAEAKGDGSRAFFCSLLWPFIDSYWVAALCLFTLQAQGQVKQSKFLNQMQWFSEKLFHDRVIRHFDSCSKVCLSYAPKLFERWNVIHTVVDEEGIKSWQLVEPYTEHAPLQAFVKRIASYRKTEFQEAEKGATMLSFLPMIGAKL